MILVVDNYDSFTYNLVQILAVLGSEVQVVRNDAVTPDQVAAMAPAGVVISPGPCGPAQAGNAPGIVRRMAGVCPVLGVCLGHQVIGFVYGARIERAPAPRHGKTVRVHHDSAGVFEALPVPFEAGLYHSLAIAPESVPPELVVTARGEDGVIMGVRHRELPVEGVQFHPESILTPLGDRIMSNFVRAASRPSESRTERPGRVRRAAS